MFKKRLAIISVIQELCRDDKFTSSRALYANELLAFVYTHILDGKSSLRMMFLALTLYNHFWLFEEFSIDSLNIHIAFLGCAHIAAKCECIPAEDVFLLLNQRFEATNQADAIRAEEVALRTLRYQIGVPTLIDFVCSYLQFLPERQNSIEIMGNDDAASYQHSLIFFRDSLVGNSDAVYRLSVVLSLAVAIEEKPALAPFKPSFVAAALVAHVLFTLGRVTSYPKSLESVSGYSSDSNSGMQVCLEEIYLIHCSLGRNPHMTELLDRVRMAAQEFTPRLLLLSK